MTDEIRFRDFVDDLGPPVVLVGVTWFVDGPGEGCGVCSTLTFGPARAAVASFVLQVGAASMFLALCVEHARGVGSALASVGAGLAHVAGRPGEHHAWEGA